MVSIGDVVRLIDGAGVCSSYHPYDYGEHLFKPPAHGLDRRIVGFVGGGSLGVIIAIHRWTTGITNYVVKFDEGCSILSESSFEKGIPHAEIRRSVGMAEGS